MLDFDLAILYGCKNGTKEVKQAVRNNPSKFPERFSWVLENEEYNNLMSKNLTSSTGGTHGGRRYKVRVFTEQGVAMLATVLRTKVAAEMSVSIMRAFVKMRHYLLSTVGENKYIKYMLLKHDNELLEHSNSISIKLLQESFDKLERDKEIDEIYFNDKAYDAYSKVLDIFNEAKEELIVVDRYTDKTFLDMI